MTTNAYGKEVRHSEETRKSAIRLQSEEGEGHRIIRMVRRKGKNGGGRRGVNSKKNFKILFG